jgi:hypothetical protein
MTKAEELAKTLTQNDNLRWDTDSIGIIRLLEQYGQLVKEAAAAKARSEILDRMHGDYPTAHDVWAAIDGLTLP